MPARIIEALLLDFGFRHLMRHHFPPDWFIFDGFELVRSGELAPPKKGYKNEQREGSL